MLSVMFGEVFFDIHNWARRGSVVWSLMWWVWKWKDLTNPVNLWGTVASVMYCGLHRGSEKLSKEYPTRAWLTLANFVVRVGTFCTKMRCVQCTWSYYSKVHNIWMWRWLNCDEKEHPSTSVSTFGVLRLWSHCCHPIVVINLKKMNHNNTC